MIIYNVKVYPVYFWMCPKCNRKTIAQKLDGKALCVECDYEEHFHENTVWGVCTLCNEKATLKDTVKHQLARCTKDWLWRIENE